LSAPHTVHCLANGNIMISMLGDKLGEAPGGFILLNEKFEIAGTWGEQNTDLGFNYDFWYQPYHNIMVSSEWGAPNTYTKGFNPAHVAEGKYGRHIYFWVHLFYKFNYTLKCNHIDNYRTGKVVKY